MTHPPQLDYVVLCVIKALHVTNSCHIWPMTWVRDNVYEMPHPPQLAWFDVTHSHVWFCSCAWVTWRFFFNLEGVMWLIHTCDTTRHMYIYIHICDVTLSYVLYSSFIRVTCWLLLNVEGWPSKNKCAHKKGECPFLYANLSCLLRTFIFFLRTFIHSFYVYICTDVY